MPFASSANASNEEPKTNQEQAQEEDQAATPSDERTGLYGRIAVLPENVADANRIFAQLLGESELFVWTKLADASGDSVRAEAHATLAEQYGLDA